MPVREREKQLPRVSSVPEFISAVLMDPIRGVEAFFRGTTQHFESTTPSVFRSEQLRRNEKNLFNSLLAAHPGIFRDDVTTLDKLVRMQHHGLPTRLLDITSNPLIALYFAAETGPKDGEVKRYEFRALNVRFPDSDRAAVMANLARLTTAQRSGLDTSVKKEQFNKLPSVEKLLHFIRQEKPYFEPLIRPEHVSGVMAIRGKQDNARIVAQSGAFLLFGENADFESSAKSKDLRTRSFIVPAKAKKLILRQLDQLNVNEQTVYPSLEKSATYLKSKYGAAE